MYNEILCAFSKIKVQAIHQSSLALSLPTNLIPIAGQPQDKNK